MSGRPLDVLEASIGDQVAVRLKGGETHRGELAGYDQHMNLVLDPTESEEGAVGGSEEPIEAGDRGSEAVEDTIIIRGDNLVSITT
ncbi:Like-Sm ribonucleoprotein core [Halobacteriales archaeon QS_3_64_16]|nr:MAG: Like-Sm ribonucleoprotein core [Halobacteriales archaeon QS_3_64_16]